MTKYIYSPNACQILLLKTTRPGSCGHRFVTGLTDESHLYKCGCRSKHGIGLFVFRRDKSVSQFPKSIWQISQNAPFCNRNVHTCAHFCYIILHCGIWDWCIVGFVILICLKRDTYTPRRLLMVWDICAESYLYIRFDYLQTSLEQRFD